MPTLSYWRYLGPGISLALYLSFGSRALAFICARRIHSLVLIVHPLPSLRLLTPLLGAPQANLPCRLPTARPAGEAAAALPGDRQAVSSPRLLPSLRSGLSPPKTKSTFLQTPGSLSRDPVVSYLLGCADRSLPLTLLGFLELAPRGTVRLGLRCSLDSRVDLQSTVWRC